MAGGMGREGGKVSGRTADVRAWGMGREGGGRRDSGWEGDEKDFLNFFREVSY